MMKVSDSEHTVDDATAVATQWLAVSAQLGWGIEGPEHAERVTSMIDEIAHGHPDPGADLTDVIESRELGTRPVDALFEAAGLLIEASGANGAHRDELLSAARGWLQLALRRAPQ